MTETVDEVAAPPIEDEEDETREAEESPSLTELVTELGHDVSVLALLEAQLAATRNMPQVRRAARDLVGAVLVAVAFITVFVLVNVAAYYGLTSLMSPWLAALVLAAVWLVLGLLLLLLLMVRAGHVTGWKWWHVFTGGGTEESLQELERARDEAEQAVHDTLGRLAPVMSVEIATAAIPIAGGMAGGVVDAGEGLLEASDQIVESLAEELPGGGVVNQVWDVVLMPGRFGVKVATTVLKRGS